MEMLISNKDPVIEVEKVESDKHISVEAEKAPSKSCIPSNANLNFPDLSYGVGIMKNPSSSQ